MSVLSGSVGRGGVNQTGDARLVQHLLNDAIGRAGGTLLAVDGIVGPKTIAAIELYQRSNGLTSDGRVDPQGATIKHLTNAHLTALSAGVLGLPIPVTQKPAVGSAVLTGALAKYLERLKKG
jgi:peptidoglycan hydrolase-like protein with peptidoglycan-binding domain